MNAYETPLAELLKTVPKDARFVEKEEFSSTYHPVGRLCHEAADRIAELEKDRDRLFKAHSAEMVRADKQADYIAQLEKGLESSIAMNKAQADRIAELERKHKEEFDYAERLLKERDK